MDAVYSAILAWVVRRKLNMALVGVGAVVVLFGSCSLVPMMGSEFTSPEDRSQYNLDFTLPAGTSLEETSRLSLIAEKDVLQDDRFVTIYATVGTNNDPTSARWRVVTVPKWEREAKLEELMELTRQAVARVMPEARVSVTPPAIVEGARDYPVAIYVQGDRFDQLQETAERFGAIFRAIPGVKDIDVKYSPGAPELEVSVNRDKAAQLGVPAAMIARSVRAAMEGEISGKYRDGDDELDVVVRLEGVDRDTEARIGRIPIATMSGVVPLSDLTIFKRGEGPSVIERNDRQRLIMVTASPDGRPLGDVVNEFTAKVREEPPPDGVTWTLQGTAKMMQESNESMAIALLLGVVFIYIVLASQFESFLHPVTIMMALPLAVVGALVALFLQGSALSMGAMIGIILLMGLVTKNGILLVDHAVQCVNRGMSPKDAILDAGPSRLRPILMTSAAMVLGMLPTALGKGPGSEFRSPMAMGVIGGVISSTFLTLLVVPVFYLMVEGLRGGLRRLRGAKKDAAQIEPAATHVPDSAE